MGSMSPAKAAVYAELHDALVAEVERIGPEGVNRAAVAARFIDRDVSERTLFRWCAEIMDGPAPARHIEAKVQEAVAARAAAPDPAADLERDVSAVLPAKPVDVAATMSVGDATALDFLGLLKECLADAEKLKAHALTDEGKIRNAKLLLQSSEHVRRTLETAARLQDSLIEVARVGQFHRAIFEMLREESPAFAERVVIRLRQLNVQWGSG